MKWLLALAALLLGCQSTPIAPSNPGTAMVVTMHADVGFKSAERREIYNAASAWDSATSGLAHIDVEFDYDPDSPASIKEHAKDNVLLRRPEDSPIVKQIDCEATEAATGMLTCLPIVLGWVNNDGGVHDKSGGQLQMNLIPDRETGTGGTPGLANVAMHEFGHVLGLQHVADRFAAMYYAEIPGRPVCLTQPDLSEFCRVNYCGSTPMKPCEEK